MKLKPWVLSARAPFLLLPFVLAFLGTGLAWYDLKAHQVQGGYEAINPGYAVLAFFGLLLAHISVNTLNEYYDYKSGIDLATNKTPFSGGSGILPLGSLKPKQVLRLGLTSLLLAAAIGVYFVIKTGWLLIPLLIIAALLVVLYTPVILKTYRPEWAPGLGLGILPILGFYFILTGRYSLDALAASIPSGILVYNLLFINEFPDVEADRKGGRKTTPVVLGLEKSARIYSASTIMVYLWIIGCVAAKVMPAHCLISLLTIPFSWKAIKGSFKYDDRSRLVPALANNVLVVLLTQLLLGIGFILGGLKY